MTIEVMMDGVESTRVDRWLWAVRLAKTRPDAAEACRGGHVRVNDRTAKPSTTVVPGDTVRARLGDTTRIVEVVQVIQKRVGAPVAVTCYLDRTPPRRVCPPSPLRCATAVPVVPPNATAGCWTGGGPVKADPIAGLTCDDVPVTRMAHVLTLLGVIAVPVIGWFAADWSGATTLVVYWFETLAVCGFICARLALHRRWKPLRGHFDYRGPSEGRSAQTSSFISGLR